MRVSSADQNHKGLNAEHTETTEDDLDEMEKILRMDFVYSVRFCRMRRQVGSL